MHTPLMFTDFVANIFMKLLQTSNMDSVNYRRQMFCFDYTGPAY